MPSMTDAHRKVCEAAGRIRMSPSERMEARRELNRVRPKHLRTEEARQRRLRQGKIPKESFLKWCERNPNSYNPIEEYQKEQLVKQKECDKKYYQQHKEQHRKNSIKYKYGISVVEYSAMVISQNGCCAICGQLNQVLSIDHDHITGRIRGLLCSICNICIGQMGESPQRLRKSADYLEQAQCL